MPSGAIPYPFSSAHHKSSAATIELMSEGLLSVVFKPAPRAGLNEPLIFMSPFMSPFRGSNGSPQKQILLLIHLSGGTTVHAKVVFTKLEFHGLCSWRPPRGGGNGLLESCCSALASARLLHGPKFILLGWILIATVPDVSSSSHLMLAQQRYGLRMLEELTSPSTSIQLEM